MVASGFENANKELSAAMMQRTEAKRSRWALARQL
jgi:hypothetical protein